MMKYSTALALKSTKILINNLLDRAIKAIENRLDDVDDRLEDLEKNAPDLDRIASTESVGELDLRIDKIESHNTDQLEDIEARYVGLVTKLAKHFPIIFNDSHIDE